MTQTGWLAGTLNYMSPEQSRGESIDSRSDLFSLGSLLFYLATGTVPFRAESALGVLHKIGNESPPAVQSFNPDISDSLTWVIERLLDKDPSGRFTSAAELESWLTDYMAHLHQPHLLSPPALVPKSKHTTGRKAWLASSFSHTAQAATAGFAILFLFGAGVGLWAQLKQEAPEMKFAEQALTLDEVKTRYQLEESAEFTSQLSAMQESLRRMSDQWDAPSISQFVASDTTEHEIATMQSRIAHLKSELLGSAPAARIHE